MSATRPVGGAARRSRRPRRRGTQRWRDTCGGTEAAQSPTQRRAPARGLPSLVTHTRARCDVLRRRRCTALSSGAAAAWPRASASPTSRLSSSRPARRRPLLPPTPSLPRALRQPPPCCCSLHRRQPLLCGHGRPGRQRGARPDCQSPRRAARRPPLPPRPRRCAGRGRARQRPIGAVAGTFP